ncbi:MAG: BamA/TamA family outer membrane protein [Chitinophagaceae bacterium]
MPRLALQISVLLLVLLTANHASSQHTYGLKMRAADRDSAFLTEVLGVPTEFSNRYNCSDYINKLPIDLRAKGYVNASLDSVRYDSTYATAVIYVGDVYKWAQIRTKGTDPELLNSIGWREDAFVNKTMDFEQLKNWQEKMLVYLENNGYPFAKVYLDSVQIEDEKISALLKVEKGHQYHIDSIRVHGEVKISNIFLQKYLDMPDGSVYDREKLKKISKKLLDLPYVQEEKPSDISLLSMGSILNLYLKPKRSSQVNVLLGFLPNSDQSAKKKLLVTGEANINLHNALAMGETIGLNWQQLQANSPRLNVLYQHPYLFNSPIGLDFTFDMYRKDSAYLNINLQLGAQYMLSTTQSGKIFLQKFQTILNVVNTAQILQNHQLPQDADVNSVNVGIDYQYNNTDYRLNPKKGTDFRIIGSVGTKKIKENNQILALKDDNDPSFDFASLYDTVKLKSYQFKVVVSAAKYFPLGRQSTFKAAFNGGAFQSANIFRNELFQIGGYKILRGFDEESQYLSRYAIGTAEYHYLVGMNSYFYTLFDGGWGQNTSLGGNISYTYFGLGLGLAFETKVGIFNLAWAVGKRDDTQLNLRQSKIHFGFANYF